MLDVEVGLESSNRLHSSTGTPKKKKNVKLVQATTFACGSCTNFSQLSATRSGTAHIKRLRLSRHSGAASRQVGKAVVAARIDAGVIIDTVDDCFLYIDWHFTTPTCVLLPRPVPPFSHDSCCRIAAKRGDSCQLKRRVDVAFAFCPCFRLGFLWRCFAFVAFFNLSLESKVAKVVPTELQRRWRNSGLRFALRC